jgi:tripartite-type tricarboxylate transporter receptor subunit TctC
MPSFRHLRLWSICFALACSMSATAWAQSWPSKPITFVVSSTAGGVVDAAARKVQQRIGLELRQPIVIDNKPGGGGHIAAMSVAKAPADGYLLLCSAGSTLVSGVVKNTSYDPMNDLVPVARLTLGSFLVVVNKDSPFKTLGDLIAHGKANPGRLFYASSSVGNSTHIGGEMLSRMVGMKATHVPYKGSPAALTDLAGGRVDFMVDSRASVVPLLQGGQLRVLAVTSAGRAPDFPEVPAVAELVQGYQIEGWIALFAAKGTSPDVIARLAGAAKKTLADPAVAQGLRETASEPAYMPPDETQKFMLDDHARVSKVVREAGITAE